METHPLTHAYWQSAAGELRDVRKLTFAALCMALCIALSALPSVPLWGGARITWGFLARSVCAWVCGPVLGLVFACAEDLLSFFLTGGGGYPFFPGYTLTTMLGVFLYALFFYKSKITVRRVFFAKLLTNIENVTLGALWMAILSGKAWYVTAAGSAVKNLICLPFQTLLLMTLPFRFRPRVSLCWTRNRGLHRNLRVLLPQCQHSLAKIEVAALRHATDKMAVALLPRQGHRIENTALQRDAARVLLPIAPRQLCRPVPRKATGFLSGGHCFTSPKVWFLL